MSGLIFFFEDGIKLIFPRPNALSFVPALKQAESETLPTCHFLLMNLHKQCETSKNLTKLIHVMLSQKKSQILIFHGERDRPVFRGTSNILPASTMEKFQQCLLIAVIITALHLIPHKRKSLQNN